MFSLKLNSSGLISLDGNCEIRTDRVIIAAHKIFQSTIVSFHTMPVKFDIKMIEKIKELLIERNFTIPKMQLENVISSVNTDAFYQLSQQSISIQEEIERLNRPQSYNKQTEYFMFSKELTIIGVGVTLYVSIFMAKIILNKLCSKNHKDRQHVHVIQTSV